MVPPSAVGSNWLHRDAIDDAARVHRGFGRRSSLAVLGARPATNAAGGWISQRLFG